MTVLASLCHIELIRTQLTGTISVKHGINKQVLDKLKVERERGITGGNLDCFPRILI